jgi:hypothetical protein
LSASELRLADRAEGEESWTVRRAERSDGTLRVSPAMAAGVTTRLFDVMDLVNLLIESEGEKAA